MNKVERFVYGKSYKVLCGISSALTALMAEYVPAFAAPDGEGGASADEVSKQVTGPMNDLVKVILNILAVVGIYMLVKSITELVNSIQQQDNSGIFHAGRGIAAAMLIISIKWIIKMFGYDFD